MLSSRRSFLKQLEAMGCNSELAGNIIVMTTLGSIFTISIGLFVVKSIGLL